MDAKRFDTLTRSLTVAGSRRQALRALVGSVLAGAVLTRRPLAARALVQCTPEGHACHDGHICCYQSDGTYSGRCCPDSKICNPDGNAAIMCLCPDGRFPCGDPNGSNCCAAGQDCNNNTFQCVTACSPNCSAKTCGGDGCGGSCGSCGSGQTCSGGNCVNTCTADCSGKSCGGDGCGGSCGSCGADRDCVGGSCQCTASFTDCGGACVTCPSGGQCSGTSCVCPSGRQDCGGVCTNLKTDEANCGQCGKQCVVGSVCAVCRDDCGGKAIAKCCPTARRTNCSGVCVNINTDEANCGTCGKSCKGAKVCKQGVCV